MTDHARIAVGLAAIFGLMAAEGWISRRNERTLHARGAVEPAGDVFAWMQITYPLAFIIPACEGWVRPPVSASVWGAGLSLLAAAKALKYWAIATLGHRWSFRVLVIPGAPLIAAGPYRLLKHPNYVAVAGEIAGAALLFGGPLSGVVFTILFGWLMLRRIRVEERALLAGSRGHIST
jgi:methyltransferase